MQYIDFTVINSDYRGRMSYMRCDSSFISYVGANAAATPYMKLLPSGLSVSGAAVSNNKKLKVNENQQINVLDVRHKLEPV